VNDLQIYEQHAERHEKAYAAFTQIYALERPKPQPPRWYEGLPYQMIPFSLIAIAGILLSALRTAPVFQSTAEPIVGETLSYAEAILAVIVIEVFVVVGRYTWVLLNAQDGESNVGEVKAWMRAGFWFAFAIAAIANLYASVSHLPILAVVKPILDLIMAVLVGLSAPVLAFISADILGILWARSDRRRTELRQAFEDAMNNWFEGRENSWNARKKDYGLKLVVADATASFAVHSVNRSLNGANEQPSLPYSGNDPLNRVNEQSEHGTGSGYTKNMKAPDLLREWLLTYQADHPEVWTMKTDDFWALAQREVDQSIKRTTAFNVRRALAEQLGGQS